MERHGRKEWRKAKGKNYSPPPPPPAFSSIASAWVPVGISVATLFYVRDMFERRGVEWRVERGREEEGEEGERMRGRMAKSQRQTATSFSLAMPPDKSERMYATTAGRCSRSSGRVHMYARTHARTPVYSHASPPTRTAGRIRGICKIPAAHVTTNCCSADRPTHRRSVKL